MAQIKTVAMIGLGSIGAYLAPRLCEAVGRENFRVIAQGARKKRLETDGLIINDVEYRFPVVTPDEICEPADLVLIAVKRPALDEAIIQIRNQVGSDTVILSVLNGVDSEESVAARYGSERVMYSLMRVSTAMHGNRCSYDPNKGLIVFGEKENVTRSERVAAIGELFDKAGIAYKIPQDMIRELWHKFMCNVGENLTCALLGITYQAFKVSEHANAIRTAAMAEVVALAQAQGVDLHPGDIEDHSKVLMKYQPANKPSTLQDIEAGRKTEIDMFAGEVVRQGKKLGVPTPVNEFLYHAIRVLEQKNDGLLE